MNIKQIENKIRRAVKRVEKNGMRIDAGAYGTKFVKVSDRSIYQIVIADWDYLDVVLVDTLKCLCPIGACLLGKKVNFSKTAQKTKWIATENYVAAKLFQKNTSWINSFTNGFDGCYHLKHASYIVPSAYKLGLKFRKEILGLG